MAIVRKSNDPDMQDEALDLMECPQQELTSMNNYQSFEGETDASDIQIPYLKLWQASSEEAKLDNPVGSLGAFLLNGLVVAERNNPLECIVLKAKKVLPGIHSFQRASAGSFC